MARLSTRDHFGAVDSWADEGDGVRGDCGILGDWEGVPRLGMLGMEDRIVRLDGS